MKKIIAVFVVLLCCFAACASFWDRFTFSSTSDNLLYKPYKADTWSFVTRAQYAILGEGSGLTDMLVVSRYEEGHESSYLNFDKTESPYMQDYAMELAHFTEDGFRVDSFLRLKPSFSAGVLRTSYGDFTLEISLQLAVNLVINASGCTDVIGFDGLYAAGLELAYDDWISLHAIRHHYSGHYSDEIMEDYYDYMVDDYGRSYAERMSWDRTTPGAITMQMEYVRQDTYIVGVSVTPFSWLRIYAEVDFPPSTMNWIKPYVIVPNGLTRDEKEDIAQQDGNREDIYEDENTERRYAYSDSYKNVMLEAGVEVTIPLWNVGTLDLAYDVKFLQEGQTYYQFSAYKESNPWYVDHNVLLSFNPEGKAFSIDVIYHHGSFPLLNFNWYQCSYISFGMTVNPSH